jgi:ribose transport system permease protein
MRDGVAVADLVGHETDEHTTVRANKASSRMGLMERIRADNSRLRRSGENVLKALAPQRVGVVYVVVAVCVVFSFLAPDTFPQVATLKQVVNGNAIQILAALALTIPMSCGVFDISEAYTMSLAGVVTAYLIVNYDISLWLAVGIAIAVSVVVGVINGLVVVVFRIDSFIGTLATGSLILAGITAVSHDNDINSSVLVLGLAKLSETQLFGLALPVYYAAGVAIALWFLLERTTTGRRMYASGFNQRAARLAGVNTSRLQFGSLVAGAFLAGVTGIVLASTIGAGSPTAGTGYLLPTFAAVFLGATQVQPGRFNAAGTVLAVLLLGTGVTGLGLANAPQWSGSLFTGVVLLGALGLAGFQRRKLRVASIPGSDGEGESMNGRPKASSGEPYSGPDGATPIDFVPYSKN